MPGPGTLPYLAQVARNTAGLAGSAEWRTLSQLMCWDAVAHCLQLAGILDDDRHRAIRARQNGDTHLLVDTGHPRVAGRAGVAAVPEGHVLGFFARSGSAWLMIHAMIATGAGRAAGNKNACLGIGKAIGWEVVDLTTPTLGWAGDDVMVGSRAIQVHHRPATTL
jgi:hypothetical protein